MASTTNEDTNPKLPSWSGEWATFKAYELKVGLEIDGTREDERKLLGPRLAKNLVGKAWELIEEVDRAKLREETGAEYLLAFLKKQRGKDKVDLMGDALRDLFMKPDVHRKEGEEFVDYIPRYRAYVKAVDSALKELAPEKKMPEELYGWYLLNVCMRLEPSDVANIKAKAATYSIVDVENTIKVMWSGGGLAQKDQERKKFKSMGKGYLVHDDEVGMTQGIYEVEEEDEDEAEEDDDDQEQLEDLAMAMLETPGDEQLLTAYQDAKKKMQYKEARKVLAKSRVARDYYPMNNRFNRRQGGKGGEPRRGKSADKEFNGDCMRCGKFGHKQSTVLRREDQVIQRMGGQDHSWSCPRSTKEVRSSLQKTMETTSSKPFLTQVHQKQSSVWRPSRSSMKSMPTWDSIRMPRSRLTGLFTNPLSMAMEQPTKHLVWQRSMWVLLARRP